MTSRTRVIMRTHCALIMTRVATCVQKTIYSDWIALLRRFLIVCNNLCYNFHFLFVDREVDEHKTLKLKCPVGKVIYIRSAIYGRTSEDCKAGNSKQIVSDRCGNKRKCGVRASNDVFGDPCHGIFKYLKVGYICVNVNWESSACSLIISVFTLYSKVNEVIKLINL